MRHVATELRRIARLLEAETKDFYKVFADALEVVKVDADEGVWQTYHPPTWESPAEGGYYEDQRFEVQLKASIPVEEILQTDIVEDVAKDAEKEGLSADEYVRKHHGYPSVIHYVLDASAEDDFIMGNTGVLQALKDTGMYPSHVIEAGQDVDLYLHDYKMSVDGDSVNVSFTIKDFE